MFNKTYEKRISLLRQLQKAIEDIQTDLKPTELMYREAYNAYLLLSKYPKTSRVYERIIAVIEQTELTISWDENKESKYNYTLVRKTSTEKLVKLLQDGINNGNLYNSMLQNRPIIENLLNNIDETVTYYSQLAMAFINE